MRPSALLSAGRPSAISFVVSLTRRGDQRSDEPRNGASRLRAGRSGVSVDKRAADDDTVGEPGDLPNLVLATQAKADREGLLRRLTQHRELPSQRREVGSLAGAGNA